MRQPLMSLLLTALVAMPAAAPARAGETALAKAVAAPTRTEANRARDRYRNPVATLSFFGVKPHHKVVELWPGGGWYTEILAPYLAERGQLWAAGPWPRGVGAVQAMQARDPATYGKLAIAAFPAVDGAPRIADESVDVVLTFRNVHSWRMGYMRDGQDYALEAFRQAYAMLKPGGVMGVVDHRLPEAADTARERDSGYLKVSTVRGLAEAAGFLFDGSSEINANPADTTDWPKGVWTLPPALRMGDVDRDRYLAIGESDRMTLRFRKPSR